MPVRLVVLDWAGTAVDHGCFAPVAPFVESLARWGVSVSPQQARGPMGLEKKDHLRALLALPDAQRQWMIAHGRSCSETDIDQIYANDFVPLQLDSVARNSALIDGLLDAVAELRERGIKIGTTTGYFAEAAERCYEAAAGQGYVPDYNVHPGLVASGRPAPWMMFRIMEAASVYPAADVIKVGDTVPDVLEGLNAGAWSIGVAATGSEVALTASDLEALPPEDRAKRISAARGTLYHAGAHYVIDSVRQMPALVIAIDALRRQDKQPHTIALG